jgi:hypothetical protein
MNFFNVTNAIKQDFCAKVILGQILLKDIFSEPIVLRSFGLVRPQDFSLFLFFYFEFL